MCIRIDTQHIIRANQHREKSHVRSALFLRVSFFTTPRSVKDSCKLLWETDRHDFFIPNYVNGRTDSGVTTSNANVTNVRSIVASISNSVCLGLAW